MSFSTRTKEELARIETKPCCQPAELAALVKICGRVRNGQKEVPSLELGTENAGVARKIFKLCKKLFDFEPRVIAKRTRRLRKTNRYLVLVENDPKLRPALIKLGVIDFNSRPKQGFKKGLIKRACCRRACLRGAFLAGGWVASPQNSYHLEILVRNEKDARDLLDLMVDLDLDAGIAPRKQDFMVYLKDGEQIVRCLNLVGAHNALLKYENVRIYKGMRNRVNRLVNCDTANLNKAVLAGVRQEEYIRLINDCIGLDKLPDPLKYVARLRLLHPEASLRELGELADPPLSKSCINHRMRKLEKIASQLRAERQRQVNPGRE
ncbi:MAG: DNA-binding protein WhiA [Peptococcaceae bacterium]|nr:DNA-binding protein WhiA [Peptococcaceae bacterium]